MEPRAILDEDQFQKLRRCVINGSSSEALYILDNLERESFKTKFKFDGVDSGRIDASKPNPANEMTESSKSSVRNRIRVEYNIYVYVNDVVEGTVSFSVEGTDDADGRNRIHGNLNKLLDVSRESVDRLVG